ncbi:MAG: sensor histidine kinase [Terriglobia bacterium]
MRLKVKLTALISLVVLILVLAVSALYLFSFVRQTLRNVQQISDYIRDETYTRARAVVAATRIPPYVDPTNMVEVRAFLRVRLSQDAGLLSLMQSAVSYSPTIDYVAITSTNGIVLAHNDSTLIGQTLPSAANLSVLLHTGLIHQLRLIYGPPQVYEAVLPLEMNHQPFCSVRIGVSTVFLAAQVTPHLTDALEMALAVIILATLTAGLLSFRLLRPLETISQSVDRMARGEFTGPLRIKREDEWGVLSSKLNVLGEQMRGDKAAYLALRENLDQLFANLVDGLMLFDHEDRLVLATASVSRFLGRPSDALVHKTASEVFGGGGPLNQVLLRAFNERRSLTADPVELPDNAETPRVAVSSHFVSEEGRPVASLVTLRDAGTRAQLQDQIGTATKLAALGRITSGVAHEVKNPLNAMILQVEILKSKLADDHADVKPQLTILSEEIRRLDRVVKTFLDFTRPVEMHRGEIQVADLVNEVFTLAGPQARKNNVHLILEPNGALPALTADRDLMKQALLNLVLNGCQAMPEGGELRVRSHASPGSVNLDVADQGTGIPAEAQEKIFALYYTTKPGGSGIGLAMAYRIIQLHEGSIHFLSEVNHGTTFRISLPA